jgi:hypothetical protein
LPPVASIYKDVAIPEAHFIMLTDLSPTSLHPDYKWLESVNKAIQNLSENAKVAGNLSWAAYNANCQLLKTFYHPYLSVLLPMFCDPAHSPAMICHAMNIIACATRCTYPGQV